MPLNLSESQPAQTAGLHAVSISISVSAVQQYRELFAQRLCDLDTRQFLHETDLVELLTPLIAQHMASDLAALRSQLSHAAPPPDWPHKKCRIVLSNQALDRYAGSELWTFEFAQYLQDQGYTSMVYAPQLGKLAQTMRAAGLLLSADVEDVLAFAPDLLHLNHFQAAQALLARLPARVPVVNMSHGLLPRAGLPGYSWVRQYSAVSIHAKAKIHLLTGTPWEEILSVPNFFDPARFLAKPAYTGQRRALLFSSRTLPQHREGLRQILHTAGYTLDHVGYGGQVASQPETLLPNYDLVFAVGRSAIEALACGCHVMLWDQGILGPMITAENFWHGVTSNFALSSCMLAWCDLQADEASSWVCEQIEQFAHAEHAAQTLHLTRQFLPRDLPCSHLLAGYARLCQPAQGRA